MKECIDRKVQKLKSDEAEYEQLLDGREDNYENIYKEQLLKLDEDLKNYYEMEIVDTVVDVVIDNDEEYQEL